MYIFWYTIWYLKAIKIKTTQDITQYIFLCIPLPVGDILQLSRNMWRNKFNLLYYNLWLCLHFLLPQWGSVGKPSYLKTFLDIYMYIFLCFLYICIYENSFTFHLHFLHFPKFLSMNNTKGKKRASLYSARFSILPIIKVAKHSP